jgi:DNA-binding transcriptional ArsR family regulator
MSEASDSGTPKRIGAERGPAIDARLAKALNHSTRARILALLHEKKASPKELSDALGEELSNVSYHCRELLKLKCIEVARREHVRGARKTTYRSTMRMLMEDSAWKRLSRETRSGISIAALGEVIERATDAIEAGTFDRQTDRHVITLKMNLDPEGWAAAADIIANAYRNLCDLETETANRLSSSGEDGIRTTVSLLSYESP